MKIQIVDRELWLLKVNVVIQEILTERLEMDIEYLALPWYKRFFCRSSLEYPSIYAYETMYYLKSIKYALETMGTGVVYINEEELRAIL
jgi:hypothetical protein